MIMRVFVKLDTFLTLATRIFDNINTFSIVKNALSLQETESSVAQVGIQWQRRDNLRFD